MYLTSKQFEPKIKVWRGKFKEKLNITISKICAVSKKTYHVTISLRDYLEIKTHGSPNLSKLTPRQRRFILTWLTPKEYELIKKDNL